MAFAGIGDDHDADGDDYSPNEGDCDDTDPNIYPGQGCDYPVRDDVEEIEDEVFDLIDSGEFDINSAQSDNLIYKLYHAVEKTEENKINTAVNMLNSFINNIQAYIYSQAISAENGNALISAVQEIIDYLEGN
ncbi:MAG: hypothetical protein ACE5RN_05870 [Nitrosopumilaceae archaeon]